MILLILAVGAATGFTKDQFGVGGGLVILPTLYMLRRDDIGQQLVGALARPGGLNSTHRARRSRR